MKEASCLRPHLGQTKSAKEKDSEAWVKSIKSEVLLNKDLSKA
jgi:hypothetical protein